MNARKAVRAVEVLFDCEHLCNCPHLLTPGHWTKNTFPREGAEDWTAVRLTVDDKLRPLFFDADGCSLYVALSPQVMLIRETVRSLINGNEFLTFSSPRRVAYSEHFDIAFSLPADFPRFVGKAMVRFEAMVDEASVALADRIDANAIRALLLDEAPVWAVPLGPCDRIAHRAADTKAFCGQPLPKESYTLDSQGDVATKYERCQGCETRFRDVLEGRAVGVADAAEIFVPTRRGFTTLEGQRFVPAIEGDRFLLLTGRIRVVETAVENGNVMRGDGENVSWLPARRMPDGAVFVLDLDAPLPPAPPSSGELDDLDGNEDLAEQSDRARTVARVLESCEQELARLEDIPSADADDVNAISAAKGYVERARAALTRRFA